MTVCPQTGRLNRPSSQKTGSQCDRLPGSLLCYLWRFYPNLRTAASQSSAVQSQSLNHRTNKAHRNVQFSLELVRVINSSKEITKLDYKLCNSCSSLGSLARVCQCLRPLPCLCHELPDGILESNDAVRTIETVQRTNTMVKSKKPVYEANTNGSLLKKNRKSIDTVGLKVISME